MSILRSLRARELSGGGARSLLDLPSAFCERIDAGEAALPSTLREPMPLLLRKLEKRLRNREDLQSSELRTMIMSLGKRVQESEQQRDVFVSCQGDVLLIRLLQRLAPPDGPLADAVVVNECVQILVRLATPPPQRGCGRVGPPWARPSPPPLAPRRAHALASHLPPVRRRSSPSRTATRPRA
tara:strand:- start:207 stop:755 length:549 start_codon:yes stop_codon:yes gene_type:complete